MQSKTIFIHAEKEIHSWLTLLERDEGIYFIILFFAAPACPLWTCKGDAARRVERGMEQLESKMAGLVVLVYA
jgi:hypothetical protein